MVHYVCDVVMSWGVGGDNDEKQSAFTIIE
jgi:hypothetical protein